MHSQPDYRAIPFSISFGAWLSCALSAAILLATPLFAGWQHAPAGNPPWTGLVSDSLGARLWLNLGEGGAWRTQNGGADWEPASQRLSSLPGIGKYLIHWTAVDAAADTLVAFNRRPWHGTADFSRRSYDAGETWQPFANGDTIQCHFLVSPSHHNVWMQAGATGFYRSLDYGQTWNQLCTWEWHGITAVYLDPAADSTLFELTYAGDALLLTGAVWRSDNLGESWYQWLNVDSALVRGGHPTKIMRTSNGDIFLLAESLDPDNRAITLLQRSTDDGQSWSTVHTFSGYDYVHTIVEDRAIPGRLFAPGWVSGGLLTSQDYGQTWTTGGAGLPTGVTHGDTLVQNPYSADLYLSLNQHGTFRSRDHGTTWQPLPMPAAGSSLGTISITNQSVFFCPTRNPVPCAQYQWQPDLGQWHELPPLTRTADTLIDLGASLYQHGDSLVNVAQFLSGPEPDWPSGLISHMAYSADNGQNWQFGPALPFDLTHRHLVIHTSPAGVRFIACPGYGYPTDSVLHVSYDLGQTWQPTQPLPEYRPEAVVQNDSIIYAADAFTLYRSRDEGHSWHSIDHSNLVFSLSNLLLAGDDIYLTTYSTLRVMHWHQDQWSSLANYPNDGDDDLNNHRLSMVVFDGEHPLFAAMLQDCTALWISRDMAQSWEYHPLELPQPQQNYALQQIYADAVNHKLWATTPLGLCYFDLAELSAPEPQLSPHPLALSLSSSPNPFNSATRITFDLPQRGNVKLDVFDLQGRLVRTLVNGTQSAGLHELRFDGSALSSGTYFVRLQSPAATRTQKLLLLK